MAAGVAAVASLVAISGTAVAAPGGPAKGTPLVFGAVGTNSGPVGIPQAVQAFQAYIANWNAHGGYKGHPIKVIYKDGGIDPTATAAAARSLVTDDNVIAMAFNSSFIDCTVNNSFYITTQIAVLNSGDTPSCYNPSVDFPTLKQGGSGGQTILIKYAISKGAKTIAIVAPDVPGVSTVISAVQAYAKTTSAKVIVPPELSIAPTAADLDGLLVSLKAQHVDTVIVLGAVSTGELLLTEAARESFGVDN